MAAHIMPRTRSGIISIMLLAVFFVGMNPPVINFFNQADTIAGFGRLYLWFSVMAIYVSLVLLWAAANDAFALTEKQIPPELLEREEVTKTRDDTATESEETLHTGGDQ